MITSVLIKCQIKNISIVDTKMKRNMKHYIWFSLICLLLLPGCYDEDALAPSWADKNWKDSLEMEYSLVKEYYEKYGVGLLTRFDLNRDLLYNMTTSTIQSNSWNTLRVDRMERTTEIDSALQFLDETLLQYFTDEDFIRDYFPRRILVGRDVFLSNSTNSICAVCMESDARASSNGINSLHSIFSRISFAVSCKLNTIYYSEENYNNFKMDNLYMFISYLFEHNDLYSLFGTDFYLPSMENCYGRPLTGDESSWLGLGVYVEEGGSPDDRYTDKYWYWNKGFVSTKWLHPIPEVGVNRDMIELKSQYGITEQYVFPNKQREVRTLINQLLFVSREVWDSYPEVVKKRFALLMAKFDEWGIDIRAVNPVIADVFPRN